MEGFIGEIRAFAGDYAPVNWRICNGASLSINEYQALYALIGQTYGGSGNLTFNLPDLRGRLLVGQGTGRGLTPRSIGEQGGAEYISLTSNNLPSHSHAVMLNTTGVSTTIPSSSTFLGAMSSPDAQVAGYLPETATTPQKVSLDLTTIQPTGNNVMHGNVMPCMAINYIICIENNLYPEHQ
ncbi:phage tail protein [Bacteroides ihuae]|uniref:phage tail protein n=1 Tax=Bacteroides ihuae TaxID=1852362 RepID=UPI0008D95F66|nr:tail fiber protein [Bacteroides ihuae]